MRARKLLFVCTGNSCRSVMAEGLTRHRLKQKGWDDIHVLSAGTDTMHGIPPMRETVEVMAEEGIDVAGHRSQPLTRDLIEHADAIFCMEKHHRDSVLDLVPEAAPRVYLLKSFQSSQRPGDPNIPDPIGRPKEVYEVSRRTIGEGIDRIMKWLEEP